MCACVRVHGYLKVCMYLYRHTCANVCTCCILAVYMFVLYIQLAANILDSYTQIA